MKRSGRDTSLVLLLLFLVLAIAAGVRFYELGSQSLWADEGNSAALASRSLARIAGDAANDIHPPLYYWLLHLWTGLFGDSEAGLRSLSAALGVLLVLTIAELGRRVFNNVTGLVAGLVAAMAPFQVYYSQEARMYVLVALEGALAMLLFWWLLCQEDRQLPCEPSHGRRLRWLPFSGQLLVLVWALGLFTHYAFPLVIALASGLYGIWLIVTRGRGCLGWRAVRWVLLLLLTMGLYAPWTGVALRQLGAWPAPDGGPGLMEQLATIFTTLAFGPVPPVMLKPWTIALFLLALIGVLPWSHSNRAEQCGTPRLDWLRSLLPPAWLLAPAIMLVALGLYRGAYLKFLLIGSPALSLLLARAIVGPASFMLRSKLSASSPAADARTDEPAIDRGALRSIAGIAWIIGSIALVAATSGAALAHYFNATSAARDDYRGISQFIVATGQSEDAVVLTAPGQAEAFDYYYRGELPVYPLPKQRPLDPAQTQDDLFRLLEHRKVYAVYWATEEADPERVIERWLDHQGYKTLDQWYGNVRLAVYVMPERRAPEETATELDARFGPRISLLGYRGWNLTPAAGEVTQLQLLWQADQQPERAYKVFLQLLDPRDQVIAQRDAEPAGDSQPTTGWAPGETIYDNHGVLIPPGTPPGSYRRIVGLYDAETFERLRLPDGSDFVSLPPITVLRSQAPPPLEAFAMLYRQRFDFGAISLLGHDRYKRGFGHAPETPIQGGDLLHATFYWRANVSPRADWRFQLVLSDAAGNSVADLAAPLVSETYLTTMWQEGEIVRGEHDLMIPADLAPDTYRLSLVLLPDEETEAGAAYLGTVRVQAPQRRGAMSGETKLALHTLPVGMLQVNCYVLSCERTGAAIVIDPGDEADEILALLARHQLKLSRILATHAHFDHLLAARTLQEATGAAFYLHAADRPLLAAMRPTCLSWLGYDPGDPPAVDGDLTPGETVQVGDLALQVRHTPGHSPGGVTFVDHAHRRAFTGDALFAGSIGRTDLPGGSLATLLEGIRSEILSLPDDYVVLPGHGEPSTVGDERRMNPYLNDDTW